MTTETANLDRSDALAKQYLDAFEKSGVPTPRAVDAALAKAKAAGTPEDWLDAARVANAFANVADALCDHYASVYRSTDNQRHLHTAAEHEQTRNRYLSLRNQAYLEVARLHLAKGDSARALSYAITAVQLSGAEPNTAGEALIRKITDYK